MKMAAALLLALPAISLAQQVAFGDYTLASSIAFAYSNEIVTGPDGALWFTYGLTIGRITPAGAITSYALPDYASLPTSITVGPDGALWMTLQGSNYVDWIGRMSTSGSVTVYQIPTTDCLPTGIAAGPDGALWFTEEVNKIGRITTAGAIAEYPVPTVGADPESIVAGPDGALWFTELLGNRIGRITTSGTITEYPVPTSAAGPWGITAGPDGALWFTEISGSNIGRITTAGIVTEYPVASNSRPLSIATGPDGALWFTETNPSAIGRITTAGAVTAYDPGIGTTSITAGPGGELWFTDAFYGPDSSLIGEMVFVTANLTVDPPRGHYRSNLTFSGSGFAPSERVRIYTSGVGSAVLASAVADAGGSFTVAGAAPQSKNGVRIFLGVGQSSGKLGAANFSMTPHLVLHPDTGPVGTTVTVDGYGFDAFESLKILWKDPQTVLGTASADIYGTVDGSAALTFTVPAGAVAGANEVIGKSLDGVTGRATFTVQ